MRLSPPLHFMRFFKKRDFVVKDPTLLPKAKDIAAGAACGCIILALAFFMRMPPDIVFDLKFYVEPEFAAFVQNKGVKGDDLHFRRRIRFHKIENQGYQLNQEQSDLKHGIIE